MNEETFIRIYCEHCQKSTEELKDLRIIVHYHTLTEGIMIVVFLYGKYRLFFIDRNWVTFENFEIHASSDEGASEITSNIARIIGAI